MPAARSRNPQYERSVFSYRGTSLRNRFIHERDASTTHLRALKSGLRLISAASSPCGRMCGTYPRAATTSALPVYPASRQRFSVTREPPACPRPWRRGVCRFPCCHARWLRSRRSTTGCHARRRGRAAWFHFFPLSVGLGPTDSCASGASTFVPSADCHSQAMPASSSYSARPLRQIFSNSPARAHCWKRACNAELPNPSNFSRGKAFQMIPVRST